MAKSFKKLVCLFLVVALATTCLTACGSKKTTKATLRDFNDEVSLKFTYAFWEDGQIFEKIYADWQELHPNCTIVAKEFPTSSFTESLKALISAGEGPDFFGLIGTPDFAIEQGMLLDMTQLWEADPDAENVLGGINEYRMGYFGTDYKWVTPIKFYPAAALVNKYLVEETMGLEMPSTDWTWEEYEDFIEQFAGQNNPTTGSPLVGMTAAGGCYTVTWYPIMADGDCIGEFGWTEADGTGSYNMYNWAEGLNLQRDWLKAGVYCPATSDYNLATYGNADIWPQDVGDNAVRAEWWYSFARYFDNWSQPMLGNNVFYVPYMEPHLEEVDEEDYTFIGTFDMGGINPDTGEYAVEAYYALKYFTWGADGWADKLKYYDGMVEDGVDFGIEGARAYSNFPICLDDDIWDQFRELWGGDDGYFEGRGDYLDDFFARVKAANWTCLGGAQIPGFGSWLDDYYNGQEYDGYTGVESAVLDGGLDAMSYYKDLQEHGTEYYEAKLAEINAMISA